MASHPGGLVARRPRLRRRKPRRYGDLPKGAWPRIARRTFDQFRAHGVTNLAAALTYRSVLSLFPGLVALVALLGLLGSYPQTYDAVLKIVQQVAPHSTVQFVRAPLEGVIHNKGGAGALLGIGLAGAVWAASGYIGAFSWATNVIWEAPRGRSWYRQWPFNVSVTLGALLLLACMVAAAVVSGPVAHALARELGLGTAAITAWNDAKWPAMVVVAALLVGGLYYLAPNVRQPPVRFLTPGVLLAVTGSVAVSVGFGLYVANFGHYNKTYGTLGAIITFLIWLWWANVAVLTGVELDSEIERERQLAAGDHRAHERIQLQLRQAD
jgi:membrane protein